MAPKDVHALAHGTCAHIILYKERDLAGLMKVQDLEVERLSRSSGWAQSNHMSPEKQGDFPDCGQRKRSGDRSQKAAPTGPPEMQSCQPLT